MPWWWLAIAIVGIFITGLTWNIISEWFSRNTTADTSYGELIKQKLKNGHYKIIAGVFNKHHLQTATHTWETDELGDDVKKVFGKSNHIRVEL